MIYAFATKKCADAICGNARRCKLAVEATQRLNDRACDPTPGKGTPSIWATR
jgi:hypothetical protein